MDMLEWSKQNAIYFDSCGLMSPKNEFDSSFLVLTQVVLMHNNGDPKEPKEIYKSIREYRHHRVVS